ncbi:FkbM family methyltransferase [uncultured Mameliella sp.]|uniref:FkbM family methyltransferase n=1 Tax=uncultured Mameliella sp. TaxID=1447087 RepID=UPI00261DD83E|nr:FkbM family methyltransferase [uncultured Mameliella sp.]
MLNDPDRIEDLILYQRTHHDFCERLLAHYYTEVLQPGDTFIDVGARVGHHLFPMARQVGPEGRGIGIEASPGVAAALVERIEKDPAFRDTLKIVEGAAADREGHATFYVRENFSGWSSLYEGHVHPGEGGEEKPVDVAFVQLDQIARDEGLTSCAFIKLDIEHAEFPALRGGHQLLKDLRPVICFENTPRHAARLNGYTMAEFSGFFEDLDYDLYDIFLNKMTRRRLAYDKFLPSYYLACPSERGDLSADFIASAEAMAQAFMDTAEG